MEINLIFILNYDIIKANKKQKGININLWKRI